MRPINWLTTISNRIRAARGKRLRRRAEGNRYAQPSGFVQSSRYARPSGDIRESLWHTFDVVPRFAKDSRRFQRQAWNTSDVGTMTERLEDRTLLAAVLVDTTTDELDGNTTSIANLIATPGGTGISLREAITAANNTGGADVVNLPPGFYQLTITGAEENSNATGDLDVLGDTIIQSTVVGTNAIIDGNDIDRVIHRPSGAGALTLIDITIQNGTVTGLASNSVGGGGIALGIGDLTLNRVTVQDNVAAGNSNTDGGGFMIDFDTANGGSGINSTITITDSTFNNNTAIDRGGAILLDPASFSVGGQFTFNLINSTLSNNTAADDGGGIFIVGGDIEHLLNITNSTISGNTATGDQGGGIGAFSLATWFVNNSTIVGNTAGDTGGGIDISSGTLTLNSSIVAGNTAATEPEGYDIFGGTVVGQADITSTTGFNLIGIDDSFLVLAGVTTGNQTGTFASPLSPNIGVLRDNGGPTQTHAPNVGSIVIDAGALDGGLGLTADQRGYTTREDNGQADIGAFETDAVDPNPNAAPLSAGDIAVIGWSSDGADPEFAVLPLVDLAAGDVIFFTDRGWDNANNRFVNTTEEPGQFTIAYTVPGGGITAGTVLDDVDLGIDISNFGAGILDTDGDQILIYQTGGALAAPTLIYGFNMNLDATQTSGWHNGAGPLDTNQSNVPPGGVTVIFQGNTQNAFGFAFLNGDEVDNARYAGDITTADKLTWLARVNDTTNWTTDDVNPIDVSSGTFNGGTLPVGAGGLTIETTVEVSGGNLVVTDSNGGTTNDNLTFTANGTNVTITDNNGDGIDLLGSLDGGTGDGTASVTVALSSFTGTLDIDSLAGNDLITFGTLTLLADQSLDFDGGTGSDTATVNGAIITSGTGSVSLTATTLIDLNSSILTFGAVNQPITLDSSTVNIAAALLTDGGTVTIRDSVGGLADVVLDSGANVTFDTEDGNDSAAGAIDLSDTTIRAASGVANLVIRTATGGTSASADITLPTFGGPAVTNLFADASNSGTGAAGDVTVSGKINLNGVADIDGRTVTFSSATSDLSVDGTSTVNIDATRNIAMVSGSSITTVDGNMTLNANAAGTTNGDFIGIDLDDADITTSGTGAISLTGTGGNTAGDFGIDIRGGATVTSTDTAATAGGITLNGTGVSGGSDGVHVTGAGSIVSSVNGNIDITGVSAVDDGVQITVNALVESTGAVGDAATITIMGTGIDNGVDISGNGAVRSANGNIDITGNSSGTSGSDRVGVHLLVGGVVQSTGAATITVSGTGGNGSTTGDGVRVDGAGSLISSVTGAILIIGQGGSGTAEFNRGVRVQGEGVISSTGTGATAATVTVMGTGGGSGTFGNHGISVSGMNSLITSVDGDIGLTGQGGTGSSEQQIGIVLLTGGQVTSTGTGVNAADITAGGTGGTGTQNNFGVDIEGSGGTTTHFAAVDGDVNITGTGGTGGNDNHGVNVILDGAIQVGTGTMTVIGSAGAGNSNGVRLSTASGGRLLANGAGAIIVTATGAGIEADFQAGSDSLIGDGTGVGLGTAASGPVTINADTIDWQGSLAVKSTGALVIQPRTTTTTIGLGGGLGTLNLDDTELGFLQNGFSSITIGDTANGTGTVSINTATFLDPVTISGGDIQDNVSGADVTAPSVTFDGNVTPGPNPGVFFIEGDVTFAANSTFTVEIGGTTPGTTANNHDQLRANSGSVVIDTSTTLTPLDFNSFGATIVGSETFTIIDVVGAAETLTGTFSGLLEGATVSTNFLGSGLTATISYAGGTDSNDAVITVETVIQPVNLSVDVATGTEAGTTVITATATADAAVVGNQTLTITPSGTGITAGDYTLSTTTITILSGATQGLVTFTIVDDQRLEGDEVATLTISNPSSGITIDTVSTQNVTITDDEIGVISFDADASNAESVDPTQNATLTITASGTGTVGLDVALTVAATDAGGGTATSTVDYAAYGSQTLTIAAGDGTTIVSNNATLDVTVDADVEADETVNLQIGSLSSTLDTHVSIGDSTHLATITNDDFDTEVTLVVGVLTITDILGGNSNDALTISFAGGNYTITDTGGLILTTAIAGATGQGTSTLVIPDTGVTGIDFNVLGGDDRVTVNSTLPSLSGDFTITGGSGTDTATVNGDIVTAGTGAVNITVSRNIVVAAGSSITAANGGITLSANSGGAATGTFTGVDINNATVSTSGSGAIGITGVSGTTGAGVGINIQNSGQVLSSATSGGGGITINGTGGGADAFGFGVHVTGASTLVDSKSGAVQITGQGGTPASSHGVFLSDGADITSSDGTGAATITISATGGTGSSSAGVIISDAGSTISSIAGAIDITGTGNSNNDSGVLMTGGTLESLGAATVTIAGSATNGDAIVLTNSAEIGDSTGSGTITLKADTINFSGTPVIDGQGALIIEPRTAATTIGLGAGAGTLSLDATELGFLSDGFTSITIGKTDAGNIDIDSVTFQDPVTLLTAAEILDNAGTDLNMTSGDTATANGTVAPGQSGTTGILNVTGGFAFADNGTFEVEIGGTTPGVGNGFHDQIDASGAVNIGGNVTLNPLAFLNAGGAVNFVPSVGDSFEIINRTGGTGTFNGLIEGATVAANFLASGFAAEISYVGGDGDDVVVTVVSNLVEVVGGALTVSDSIGEVNTYEILLINGGADIQITDATQPIFAGAGATQVDQMTVTVPAASVTTSITFNGGEANDSLEVDFTGTDPTGGLGLTFNGGGQTATPGDTLSFTNGAFTTTTYTYDNLNDGNVDIDGTVFNYFGLEPITSTITAANVILNYSAAVETITISDAGGGSTTVNSTLGEITTFVNPTTLLQINAGDTGVNKIELNALTTNYPADIDINGGNGGDSVVLRGSNTLAADKSLTIDAGIISNRDFTDSSVYTAALASSGTGTIELNATEKIFLQSGAGLTTVNGGITLNGNSTGASTAAGTGVDLVDAVITSTGTGAIAITGQSGQGASLLSGVDIRGGTDVTSTLATSGGAITITGSSDVSSTASDTFSFGVRVRNSGTLIDSKSGAIQITGRGGDGESSHGVFLSGDADITSSDAAGAATITVNATGGSGSTSGGLVLNDVGTTVTSIAGAINISAIGGSTSGAGLSTTTGPKIASLGAATLTIEAEGTDGTGSDAFVGVGLTIGDAAGTGTITLTGDEFTFTGASAFDGSGALIIQPQTAGTTIELGDINGTLSLNDTELGFLSDGFTSITIGNATAGDVNLDTAAFTDPLTIITAGTIRDEAGTDLTLAGADVATLNGTVTPGQAAPGVLTVTGAVTFANNREYQVQIGGTTPGVGNGFHDQIDATGAVTIGTGVTLTTSAFLDGGGTINFVPSVGETFEIINRTGGAGTFSGLAEGAIISNFLSTTLRAQISYLGGDGDDVVLSILPPDVNVNAGALLVNNEAGDINTYIITLINGGATIQIEDTTSLIFAGTGATQVDPMTVTVPAASVTASITFNGRAAADSLEVNRTGGDPTLGLGLTWNGGDPAAPDGDILSFSNGTVTTTTVNYSDANSGNVDVDGIVHTFTELEDRAAASGITSSLASSNVVLNYSTTAETIDTSNPGGGSTTVNSAASASTTFTNPTTQLTVNAGDTGDDIINVTSLAASYPAAIAINGQGGSDAININGAVSTSGNDITLAAESVTTTATVATGAGSVAITADGVALGAAVSGTGTLTIAPQTATSTIGLGGALGTLNLDDAELAFLTDGFSAITIGDTAAGTATVNIDTTTFSDPVTIAGGTINDTTGADIAAGTNAVTLQSTVAPGAVGGAASGVLNVTGNVTLAANDTFEVEIGGMDPGELATTHDQINVTGTVTIGANVTLTTSAIGAFVPFAGDEFIIIDNDGAADAVSGTFLGLAEGAKIATFLGSGRSGTVSYVGGDGNDVTITGDGFFVSIDGAGNLVLTDNAGTNDAVTIQADPGTMEYVITHATELIGNQVAPFTGTGTMVVRVPFAAVTGTEIIANLDGGDDSLNVDYSLGAPFGKSITLNGGEAGETNGDKLFITGDNGTTVASGVYTPSTTAEAGQHVLTLSAGAGGGTETITFAQVEQSNQVSAIPSYTLTTGGSNDVLSVDADTVGAIQAATITGTTDLVPITPITFFDVTSFTVDTATNDTFGGGQGNDSVTVSSGLDDGVDLARNLVNFVVDTGAVGTGNVDSVTTNAVIDVPGSVTIDNAETVDLNADVEAGTSLTISNVGTEIDLAQDVDLTAENGDLNLATNVTLIDLSGAAGTNSLVASDSGGAADGNISAGAISDSGTPAELVIDGDNAVTTNAITVQSTVAVLANQDATGAEGFSNTGTIATTNDTATAVSITVNAGGGGTGNASLGVISAGTTSGAAGGRVTVATNAGAITDGNGATNNLTAGNAILTATAGVGTVADPIETTISRLEATGGTGGVFVTDVDSLTIGGIDVGTIGVSSGTGNIDVRTTTGTLTVEENVTSTTSGNILLKTTDTAGVGEDLTVNAGVTISTNTGNIDIQAGDNLTLVATSHLNAPGGTIAITGDSGDADAGVGSTLTIAAELDSTGTAINGGGDDDIYDFFYPAGATNSGTATIADTGGTDEVMIHGTAAAEELFLTTADPPTTATTEQVTRGTITDEPVIIPSDIEAVTLLGGDGNDIFHVQPSMLFPVTVNGDNPSFGDAGVPPGDQLDLDTFGNSFTINGKTIFVANGTPNPYQGITFLNIETVPLSPASAGPDQSFDFDDPTNSGPVKTQAGFVSVNPDTIFTTGNFGWQRPMTGFETGTNTGIAANFINDGHTFAPTSGADTNTFSATVGNGWVMATIAFGSDYQAIVGMQIENADDNTVIASNLSVAARETDHVTVLVLVQDGTLDLRFRDPERETNTFRRVSIKGIDIETDGGTGTLGFLSMGFPTPGTLAADGTTIDTFPLSAAEPNSLVTVATTLGTLSGTDADPNIEGFQVLTDGAGEASILIQRPSAAGQALVDLSSVTGRKTGCIVIDYGQVAGRNFDFNTNVSETFSPFDATTNPDGYIGVVVDDLFTAERGYGWTTTAPDNFQVTPSIGGSMPELVDDGHIASDARTFRTTLANGTYQVHVTMGAYADHQSKSISANGVLVLDAQTIVNRTLFETIFTTTVTSGQLDLTFSQNDDVFGSNQWIINALEIRPTASVVAITPPANVGDVDAQRTNLTVANTLSFATTAPDGTLMTVSSTLGTITTADADPTTAGTQVAVAGGMVTFDLLPGNKAGTPTIEIHSLDGEHRATVNDAAFLNYVVPVTRRFDFNNGTSDPASQSVSVSGFVGVSLRDQTPAIDGFGFNENRMSGVFQSGDIPGITNDDFYRDGIRREVKGENGRGLTNASFSIEARAGIDYDVRVYLGAPNLNFMNFSVAVEGAGTQTVGTLTPGNFTSLTFPMANDEDGDGFIKISFLDEVAPYDGFGIPGIDIAVE